MGRQDALPDVRWKSALPESDLENVWTLAQERSLGIVSQETAAAKRGYSWELEKARMAAAGETPREAQVMSSLDRQIARQVFEG